MAQIIASFRYTDEEVSTLSADISLFGLGILQSSVEEIVDYQCAINQS